MAIIGNIPYFQTNPNEEATVSSNNYSSFRPKKRDQYDPIFGSFDQIVKTSSRLTPRIITEDSFVSSYSIFLSSLVSQSASQLGYFLGGAGRSITFCSVPFRSNLKWKNMANETYHHGNSMSLVLFLLMTYCCFYYVLWSMSYSLLLMLLLMKYYCVYYVLWSMWT